MMFAVIYLSAKLSQVSGRGLFQAIRDYYPRWILYPTLVGVLIGNSIEAGADLRGMAAAVNVLLSLPFQLIVVATALVILALQVLGSYPRSAIRSAGWPSRFGVRGRCRVGQTGPVLAGTFIPTIHLDAEFLGLLVAVIGTSLSAYLYTWQSNEEVEEEIAAGRTRLPQRVGATGEELRHTRRDVAAGMFFSDLIVYFIILATGWTLYPAGEHDISPAAQAAQAAQALRPLAGDAAGILFALGVVGVGFLAAPVTTTGAAYDLAQTVGWRHGLNARPSQAKKF